MNTKRLVMLNRLNLAVLRQDFHRFDHSELVEIQLDLIETLSLCFDRISQDLNQEVAAAEKLAWSTPR